LEEYDASIFRVQKYDKQETSMKYIQHGGISQKLELFIDTAVRASNPT
jgi:3-polyprenyl-4-hydroxybenzoate decarboxylase